MFLKRVLCTYSKPVHTCQQKRPYSSTHLACMYVRMTSQCCNSRLIYMDRHEVKLSLLGVTCDFHHGRALCWHCRQPHRHKEPFICPLMFKPRSRHAARCPSGPNNKPASICACMHECVYVCVHMSQPPSSTPATSAVV